MKKKMLCTLCAASGPLLALLVLSACSPKRPAPGPDYNAIQQHSQRAQQELNQETAQPRQP